ncbi:MAG: putative Mg(2+) transport ATPase [Verrucomicrobia bacterium ADurb.Bin345]|nr:MAG: putative Mg(2+) transport ATPase [Verrucomicrobia bacterium ADurb.Bin345]
MAWDYQDLLKLLFAFVAGGLVGFEREFRDKAAGLRTLILISVGSAVFTSLAIKLDTGNIAANVINGVGFLGAGVIMRDWGRVTGLTTASTVWLTAALGMTIGGGQYGLAVAVLGATMAVLWFLPQIEVWICLFREERNYEIVCAATNDAEPALRADFQKNGLAVRGFQQRKVGDKLHFFWRASGPRKAHEQVIRQLVSSEAVSEFRV